MGASELHFGAGPLEIKLLAVELESEKRERLWLFQKNRIPLLVLDLKAK